MSAVKRFRLDNPETGDYYTLVVNDENKEAVLFMTNKDGYIKYNDDTVIQNCIDYKLVEVIPTNVGDFIAEWGSRKIDGYNFEDPSSNFYESMMEMQRSGKFVQTVTDK